MTKFENSIYNYIKKNNGKVTAHQIGTALNVIKYYDETEGDIIKMIIQRMIKHGVAIELTQTKYKVKQ